MKAFHVKVNRSLRVIANQGCENPIEMVVQSLAFSSDPAALWRVSLEIARSGDRGSEQLLFAFGIASISRRTRQLL